MRLGLSLPTVTQNLTDLLDEGLIAESGTRGNTGGRSAVAYSCVASAHTAIGMDITKHHITAVALDLRGRILGGIREKHTFERSDAYYRQLGRVVDQVIEQNEIAPESVLGVGFGVPGLITEDNRGVFYGKILNFTGATVEEFSHYIPFPAKLFNDANAACFAETWLTEDVDNTFYIMLSNNVGGAVRINRLMYPGDNLHAGEVGHLTIHPEGKPCYCGQRGCVMPIALRRCSSRDRRIPLKIFLPGWTQGNNSPWLDGKNIPTIWRAPSKLCAHSLTARSSWAVMWALIWTDMWKHFAAKLLA